MAKKILVVDDSVTIVDMISEALSQSGFGVITALDGEDGLNKARQEKPDLIVLDVEMPKMNGYLVCKKLKEEPATANMPIVILSVRDSEADKAWGIGQGADEYLAKPFEMETLIDTINRLLG